ncbi:hypothetical protein [Virgibacillus pantothenticus]|uniref:hypothetical protein n=1 Tax=Virgibacillus pantothenticus TaxID=1473 RepID=UPI00098703F0|nr:hypothetical protein [Virgibacillus pantothenticus]
MAKKRKALAIFLVLLITFSLFAPLHTVMAKEGDRQLLLGPVIDKDGNVTFEAIHEKEQLYLLGSFHE